MRRRAVRKLRPGLERFESKALLSASPSAAHPLLEARAAAQSSSSSSGSNSNPIQQSMSRGFKLFRITDTSFPVTVTTVSPVYQVLVQTAQPVPGQVYNILNVSLRNGSKETFTAADDLQVKLSSGTRTISPAFPILTGNQVWQPGQFITFYILTKKYYPVSVLGGGFTFSMVPGAVAIPGPSGIALRVKYNPATFARILDYYVSLGPGPEGGKGPPKGLPDTAIWEFTDANNTNIGRNAPRGGS